MNKLCVFSNLASFLDECNVGSYAKWPINMQFVFVELKQEYDQYEQCVEHEECEYGFVSQFDQFLCNTCLFGVGI